MPPIERITKADFDYILTHLEFFWGERAGLLASAHHPIYFYELGDTAYVLRSENGVLAYLFGVIAQTSPTGYVHLIGVRQDHRRHGLARSLYDHFIEEARQRGCTRLKAITRPENTGSIAFHRAMGMELLGKPDERGIPVVRDYRGPGETRVVFDRAL